MIGDVVFFRKESSFISRMIAYMTKSEFTHVGIIIEYDEEMGVATIIESNRFVKTRIVAVPIDEKHVVYTTGDKPEEQVKRILKYAYSALGTKYDYMQIVGLFLSLLFRIEKNRLFNSGNKLICSELIDLSYYKAGVKRKNNVNIGNVTPQELLEVYEFTVRKGV